MMRGLILHKRLVHSLLFVAGSALSLSAQAPLSVVLSSPTSSCNLDANARITLTAAAGAQGTTVQLTSSAPSSLPLPATLVVPAGSSSATVVFRCTPSQQALAVTITATVGTTSQSAILNILAPLLDRVSLKENTTIAPNGERIISTYTGAATLLGPAPASGVIVSLASSHPTLASIPASVSIPAGASSANFTVSNLRAVSQPTTVTITGTGLGASRTVTFPLLPATPKSLVIVQANGQTVSEDSLRGGALAKLRLVVSGPAGAGGLPIIISGSNPAINLPSSLSVPSGDTIVEFQLRTTPVAQVARVVITTTVGSTTKSVTLSVTPATVSSITIANTIVGGQSVQARVTADAAPPSNGLTVKLTTNNPNVLTVPTTVVIPPGETSVTFPVTSQAVEQTTNANITAIVGQVSTSAPVTLLSEGITDFTIAPSSLASGGTTTGRLTALPGHNGFTVTLTSADATIASVPATVIFAANETNKTFVITGKPVASFSQTTITARVTSAVSLTNPSLTRTINPSSLSISTLSTANIRSGVATLARSATVSLSAPTLNSVSTNPREVVGGSNTVVTGTIHLSGAAPAGLRVQVTSDADAVGIVQVADFAPGASSTTFTARTLPVAARKVVTISAQIADGRPQSTTVTLLPRP